MAKTIKQWKEEAKKAHKMWLSGKSVEEIAESECFSLGSMRQKIKRWRSHIPGWFESRGRIVCSEPVEFFKDEASLAHKLWTNKDPIYELKDIAKAYNLTEKQMQGRVDYWRKKIPGWFKKRSVPKKTISDWKKEAEFIHEMWLWDREFEEMAYRLNISLLLLKRRIKKYIKKIPDWFLDYERGLFADWRDGLSIKVLAKKHGKTFRQMDKIIEDARKKYSLPYRNKLWSRDQIEKASILYSRGLTYKAIADIMNTTYESILGMIQKSRKIDDSLFPIRKHRKGVFKRLDIEEEKPLWVPYIDNNEDRFESEDDFGELYDDDGFGDSEGY